MSSGHPVNSRRWRLTLWKMAHHLSPCLPIDIASHCSCLWTHFAPTMVPKTIGTGSEQCFKLGHVSVPLWRVRHKGEVERTETRAPSAGTHCVTATVLTILQKCSKLFENMRNKHSLSERSRLPSQISMLSSFFFKIFFVHCPFNKMPNGYAFWNWVS